MYLCDGPMGTDLMLNDEVVFHVIKNFTIKGHPCMQYTLKVQVQFRFFFLLELFNFESKSLQPPKMLHPDTS